MHIATIGDVALDVIVDVPGGLRADDDAEATISLVAGGQAANVASWAAALGATATLIGPRAESPAAGLVAERLARQGVGYVGIPVDSGATVVSILASGTRTLASDAGDQSWLTRVAPALLPIDADWLHISAYPVLRAADPEPILRLAAAARRRRCGVSIDLSSAALLTAYGVARFRSVIDDIAPDVLFANQLEWDALAVERTDFTIVLKRGAHGIVVRRPGADREDRFAAVTVDPSEILDLTGAGDALAAGYLVGGEDLALSSAATCIRQVGAQPAEADPRRGDASPS